MTRQRFENDKNLLDQEDMKGALRRTLKWGFCEVAGTSNGHYQCLDYLCTNSPSTEGVAWVEMKDRRPYTLNPDDKGDPKLILKTVMLSFGKWREGLASADDSGLPFVLFFRFKEGIFRYTADRAHIKAGLVKVHYGGRYKLDRDGKDIEPVVMIPEKLWEEVKPTPVAIPADLFEPVEVAPAPPEPERPF